MQTVQCITLQHQKQSLRILVEEKMQLEIQSATKYMAHYKYIL